MLSALGEQLQRFTDLRRSVQGVSQRMLTQTLRGLERDGFVTRSVYAEVPPRVEYSLTPLGTDLAAVVGVVRDFAYARYDEVEQARARYDAARA